MQPNSNLNRPSVIVSCRNVISNPSQSDIPHIGKKLEDLIFEALSLAGGLDCDLCGCEWTTCGEGPDTFPHCGHLACHSCFSWSQTYHGGHCSKCFLPPNPVLPPRIDNSTLPQNNKQDQHLPTLYPHLYASLCQTLPCNDGSCSINGNHPVAAISGRADAGTIDINVPELYSDVSSDLDMDFGVSTNVGSDVSELNKESSVPVDYPVINLVDSNGCNPKPQMESDKPSQPKTHKNSGIIHSLGSPRVTRYGDSPNKITITYPDPMEFVMYKLRPVRPGSLKLKLYEYVITATSCTVELNKKKSPRTKHPVGQLKRCHPHPQKY